MHSYISNEIKINYGMRGRGRSKKDEIERGGEREEVKQTMKVGKEGKRSGGKQKKDREREERKR